MRPDIASRREKWQSKKKLDSISRKGVWIGLLWTHWNLQIYKNVPYLTVLIFLYFYSMIVLKLLNLKVVSSTVISLPILTVFGLMMIHMMQSSGYLLKTYGVTWKNGMRSLWESLGSTAIVLGLLVMAKWLLLGEDPLFKGIALFQPSYAGYSHGVAVQLRPLDIAVLIGGYCIFAGSGAHLSGRSAELATDILRRAPQGAFGDFDFKPSLSMIHLHLSFSLAIAVYFFGMLWGWMYARHRTLAGVIVSHLMIGAFAFFILGIQEILRA